MDITSIRAYCTGLPAVTEDIKWGHDLVFSVGGKMFCVFSTEPPFRGSFKLPDDDFEEMAAKSGFIPAPYMARAKWVMAEDIQNLSSKDWKRYIHQSYELVKARLTKKVRIELGL